MWPLCGQRQTISANFRDTTLAPNAAFGGLAHATYQEALLWRVRSKRSLGGGADAVSILSLSLSWTIS
jgi:hypothetical protein